MSSEHDTPGTSSSCYSNSSNSSGSAENISTVENGEFSVVSFLMPVQRSMSPDLDSYVHLPSCTCSFSSKDSNFDLEAYRIEENSALYRKKCTHHVCQNHLLDTNYTRLLPGSEESLLLKSMEKGVLFPVIHWSPRCNDSPMRQTQWGPSMTFNQGIYKELKRVIPPDVWLRKASKSLGPTKKAWLVLGYKSLEKTLDSSLEATWKEWTGVRHIYLNLRNDFDIKKISFYTRVHPQDNLDLFMYLVLMEIDNVDDRNHVWLLDFIQRTRVERMKGFLTVYTEMEEDATPVEESNEYFKYVSNPPYKRDSEVLTAVEDSDGNGTIKFIEKLLNELNSSTTTVNDHFLINGT